MNTPIILGRPSLSTGKMVIDVEKGEVTVRMHDQKITFNILNSLRPPDKYEECNMLQVLPELDLGMVTSHLGGLRLDSPMDRGLQSCRKNMDLYKPKRTVD